MKNYFYFIPAFLLLLVSCQEETSEKIEIAAAANMQFPIKELTASFEEKTGIPTSVSIASSGKLTNQIKNGAPYEVFLSADMGYPEELYKKDFTAGKPKAYAFGKLVLWTTGEDAPSLNILKEEKIKHIAIGNPRLAPYGVAAKSVLKKHKLYSILKEKYVMGESITQVNQFITSNAADIGFTALAVVKSPNNRDIGKWIEIPDTSYAPIGQGTVLIKQEGKISDKAQQFYDFLFSQKARNILSNYGYSFQD
ncbi:MAG: molybdate ABC transporter substrate-binding protein [Psychroflexus sp.]|nr:molybdate ABC transporter substrate-binding protein [Psychroflexus sp.]MDN6309695.1 molybdate ABC transporter substrate-binding protein [Psychroflexus sp.]